jgi:RNA recognition motif-containing protein
MKNKTLFIGNLDFAVTEEEVKTLLSNYGTVVTIKMHKKKGYAFIEMSDETEAAQAVEKLSGIIFKDREVRISMEMKAKKAKALSIKKYNERAEHFSSQRKSENPHKGLRTAIEPGTVEVESNGKYTGFEDRSADKDRKNKTTVPRTGKNKFATHKPADSPHPQRKEWSHDKPAYPARPSRDGKKSGHGRSPQPEINYNSRERYSGTDGRPPRNHSRDRSGSPHPQRKEWSHDKPAYPARPSGPSRQPGTGKRDDSKPRHTGSSPNRFSRPESGPRRKNSSAHSAQPKRKTARKTEARPGARRKTDGWESHGQ